MTGDSPQEAWTAFLRTCTPETATRDRVGRMSPVEVRMLHAAIEENR